MLVLKRSEKKLPKYTYLGCVITRHRAASCRRICVPIDGIGACGRLAPHAMVSRIQAAIAAQQAESD
jgi:hypothetical protein